MVLGTLAVLLLLVAVATLSCLSRLEDRVMSVERRLDALLDELRSGSAARTAATAPPPPEVEMPPIRLTLQEAGPDPGAVAQLLADRVGMTRASADALVNFLPAELPLKKLSAQEAYELRAALSEAGAIASLFLRPPGEGEPHPLRPAAPRARPDAGGA